MEVTVVYLEALSWHFEVYYFICNWGNPFKKKKHSQCPSQDLNRSYVRIITTWLLQML